MCAPGREPFHPRVADFLTFRPLPFSQTTKQETSVRSQTTRTNNGAVSGGLLGSFVFIFSPKIPAAQKANCSLASSKKILFLARAAFAFPIRKCNLSLLCCMSDPTGCKRRETARGKSCEQGERERISRLGLQTSLLRRCPRLLFIFFASLFSLEFFFSQSRALGPIGRCLH